LCPDILLLDLHMPRLSGLQVAQALSRRPLPTRIVVLTGFALEPYVATLILHVVRWCLSKTTPSQDIVRILRQVHAGQRVLQATSQEFPGTMSDVITDARPSNADLAVLHLLAEGHRNAEIAHRLSISERVVQFRLS
jgi:DNA-binding NarL/FixJ family response regulator